MQNPHANAENLEKELNTLHSKKEMENYLLQKLSPMEMQGFSDLLQNPNALKQLLNSKEAKDILENGLGGKHFG